MAKGGITIGALKFVLGLDGLAFEKGANAAQKRMKQIERDFKATGDKLTNIGAKMSAGLTLPLTAFAAKGIQGAKDQAAAMAQVEAALASMGPVAGRTASQLAAAADAMEMRSLFDADVILTKVTANLLTFGNVTGEVFDKAQQAAIDMAARLGGDPQAAAIMLGKALNDPAKGLTALTRVGVSFTTQQAEQIKAMVAAGDAANAQRLILAELERQYGGAAKAAADASPWRAAQVAMDRAADTVGEAILPLLPRVTDAIVALSNALTSLPPGAQTAAIAIGAVALVAGPLVTAAGVIVSAVGPLAASFGAAATAAGGAGTLIAGALTPILPIVAGVAAAAALIYTQWDKIAPVLSRVQAQFEAVFGPAMQGLIAAVSGALTALWDGPLGSALRIAGDLVGQFAADLLGTFGTVLVNGLSAAVTLISGSISTIVDAFRLIGRVLTGDFSGAWDIAKKIVANAINTLIALIGNLAGYAPAQMRAMVSGIYDQIVGRLSAIWETAKAKVKAVSDAFYKLYDDVVGHSFIPDMVDGVGLHIARLDDMMVAPIKRQTAAASADFAAMQVAVNDNFASLALPIETFTERASAAFRKLKGETAQIIQNLFPEIAAQQQFEATLNALAEAHKRGQLSAELHAEAVARLREEYLDLPRNGVAGTDPIQVGDSGPIEVDVKAEELGKVWAKRGGEIEATNVRIIESFSQMAQGALQSLDRLVKGFKSGNVIDIIGGLLDVLERIGQAVGGFKIGPVAFGGARAMGGPVDAGKTYLVGERGPELLTMGGRGYVTPNHALNDNQRVRVEIAPSPYFDARVDGRSQQVVTRAAPTIGAGTMAALQRRQARAI